jgi:predicted MPP superfamily phosphohydrolase
VKNKIKLFGLSVAFLVIMAFVIYGAWVEPGRITIHHVPIRDSYFAGILENKVVVQISDLHIRTIGNREKKVLALLRAINPDIIFLTGDYVQWEGPNGPALYFLSRLQAKIGVWAVMGDYDYSDSRKSCAFCHEEGTGASTRKHAVRFLKDSMDSVHLPEGTLRIGGFDGDTRMAFSRSRTLKPMNAHMPGIILSHNPLNFDLIGENQHLVMLAGDTHGGQVPLPAWLFKILGYKKNALYNQGLFEKGLKKLFVSSGVGTSHLSFRLFRPPEVVVFHFTPS